MRYFVLLKSVWKIWTNKESHSFLAVLIRIMKFIQRIIECMTRNVAIRSTVPTLQKHIEHEWKNELFISSIYFLLTVHIGILLVELHIWYFVNNDKCNLLDKWKKCLVLRVQSERINQKTTFLLQNDYNELKQRLQQDEENLIFIKS